MLARANCQDGGSLVRFGGPIAVGFAAIAISLSSYQSLPQGSAPADPEARGETGNPLITGSMGPAPASGDPALAGAYVRDSFRVHFANFDTAADRQVAFAEFSAPPSVRSSFGERFTFERANAPGTLSSAQASVSFAERFSGEASAEGSAPSATAATSAALSRPTSPRLAASAPPAPARPVVVQSTPKPPRQAGIQLASASDTSMAENEPVPSSTMSAVNAASPSRHQPTSSSSVTGARRTPTGAVGVGEHLVVGMAAAHPGRLHRP